MKTVIYQMLLRLWGKGKFSSVDEDTFRHLRSLGVSHVWFTGIPRHASGEPFVKGDPGSPYAISDYYDTNPYLADNPQDRMAEFADMVSRVHAAGLKVIVDFVPNHIARNYSDRNGGLPHCGYCDADWTDTFKLDYSNPELYAKLLSILRFWASYGVDGFRCDMVELVPPEFFKYAISAMTEEFPGILFIAEVYDKFRYGYYVREVGFDMLYDKSGLYDVLADICRAEKAGDRGEWGSAVRISRNWQFLGDLQPNMLNFLENHDEVRAASGAFAGDAFRTLPMLAVSALLNNAPFMIYFGEEIGIDASESDNCRTSIFNLTEPVHLGRLWAYIHGGKGLSARERSFLSRFRNVVGMASKKPFSEGLTYDLGYCNGPAQNFDVCRHFAFLRHCGSSTYLVCSNFSGAQAELCINVPEHAVDFLGIQKCHSRIRNGIKVTVPAYDAAIIRL